MEQENLDDIVFPESFGISSTETISSDDLSELVLGGSVSASPDDISSVDDNKPEPVKATNKSANPKAALETPQVDPIEDEEIQNAILEEDVDTSSSQSTIDNEDNTQVEQPSGDIFESLAKDLFEIGIFTQDEDEDITSIKTPEDVKDRFLKEISSRSNQQIYNFLMQKHGQEGVDMFQSVFVNGIAPKEYLTRYAEIEDLSELDLTKESNQERVYRSYYKDLDWDDQDIEDGLQKLKDYGDLEIESQKIHKKLITKREKDLQIVEQNKLEEARRIEAQKAEYMRGINEILVNKLKQKDFDGIPVTEKVARESFYDLTTEKYQLPNGEMLTEFDKQILELRRPENFEKKVKLWLLLKNNLDLTKVKQKAVSEKESAMFNNLAMKEKTVKRTTKVPINNNNFTSFLG